MASKLKSLLLAGMALPLACGLAMAQTAPAAKPADASAAASETQNQHNLKQPGAIKATPAEKKAAFEKAGGKTAPHKAPRFAKKQAAGQTTTTAASAKANAGGAANAQKPGATGTESPAKKL